MGMREGAAEKRADLSKKRKCGGDEIIIFLARIFAQKYLSSILDDGRQQNGVGR